MAGDAAMLLHDADRFKEIIGRPINGAFRDDLQPLATKTDAIISPKIKLSLGEFRRKGM